MDITPKSNKKRNLIIIVALVLVALLIGTFVYKQTKTSKIELTPEYVSDNLISTSGRFVITGAEGLSQPELSQMISFEPFREFQLSPAKDSGSFILQTYLPLDAGKLVKISLSSGKSWQFQTEDTFKVLGTFPADKATDVFTSTSIEILLSYNDIPSDNIQSYISISPDMEFYATMANNRIVISPPSDYYPAMSEISVTISGDLPRADGTTLGQDFSFSFTTGGEEDPESQLSSMSTRVTENVIPGDPVLLKLRVGENLLETDLVSTVYKFASPEDYLNALYSYRDSLIAEAYSSTSRWSIHDRWQLDTSNLEMIEQISGKPLSIENNYSEKYVLLDKDFAPGWYGVIVEGTMPSGGKVSASKLLQISPLSVYHGQTSGIESDFQNTLLAWINDTETGLPVENADFTIEASNYNITAKTDKNGLAKVSGKVDIINRYVDNSYAEDDNETYEATNTSIIGLLKIKAGDNIFYDVSGQDYGNEFNKIEESSNYLSYLFTDRPVYRHTDTIKLWGAVVPRTPDTKLPENLKLVLYNDKTLEKPITLNENGTFVTEWDIDSLIYDYTSISIESESGSSFATAYCTLADYTKPEYETTSSVEQPIYTAWGKTSGETGLVPVNFTSQHYEGTPAQNYTAVVRPPNESYGDLTFEPQTIVTDKNGKATVLITPEETDDEYVRYQWRPKNVYYGFYSSQELNQPQVQGGSFLYLDRDMMILLEDAEKVGSINGTVNNIDTSKIKTPSDALIDQNLAGSPVQNQKVTVRVFHSWFEKIPDGTRYDIISKQNVTAYRNEWQEEEYDVFSVTTDSQGKFKLTDLPVSTDPGEQYYIIAETTDTRGEPLSERIHYSSKPDYNYGDVYKLLPQKAKSEQVMYYDYYQPTYEDGETLNLYLSKNGEDLTGEPGKILYFTAQNSISGYGVEDTSGVELPFNEDLLPNYAVSGAYFDGRHVYSLNPTLLQFNPEKRNLDIEIMSDKPKYSPEDSAKLSFKVTESESKAPAANAKLVVALVDEAIFAIEEQTPDFLENFYREKYFPHIIQYSSYENMMDMGGGMGGGGPYQFTPRTDFPDTILFKEVTTDNQGVAEVEVTLPDNLTSWRITALALSADKKAGNSKSNFTVSKDFYLMPAVPTQLIIGDDLVINVNSAGEKVAPSDTVSYTCTIDGRKGTYIASGHAGDFVPIALEHGLPAGEYTITVGGECNGLSDAVSLPFSVVDSGVNVPVYTSMPLDKAAEIGSTSWPVTYGFYDKSQELSAEIISYFLTQNGERIDQKIARKFALKRMQDSGLNTSYLDTSVLTEFFENYTDYFGYRLFTYSEVDRIMSARLFQAMGADYSGGEMYTPEDMPPSAGETAAANMFFSKYVPYRYAAEKDAIISSLNSSAYTTIDKFYLTVALANLGEDKLAGEWYTKLTDGLTEQMDDRGHKMLSLNGNSSATTAALMAATALNQPEAEGFAWYLLNTPATTDLYLPELMYFVSKQVPAPKDVSVSYSLDGETVTLDLKDGIAYSSFSKTQLENANFKATGDVWVNANYTAGLEKAFNRDSQVISVSKTIESVNGEPLSQGSLAKITISYNIPDNISLNPETQLQLSDYIPTGMRYESIGENYNWYLSSQNNQRVSFSSYDQNADDLVYYARCITPGNYVVESAFIRTFSGTLWGASERDRISVN